MEQPLCPLMCRNTQSAHRPRVEYHVCRLVLCEAPAGPASAVLHSLVTRCDVRQVHDGRNLKGRANDAIASACLYISCRQEGVPRTFKVSENGP